MDLTIFLLSYFLILSSLLGYGLMLHNVFKKTINLEFEFSLLASVGFLISISFLTHLFFKHGYLHNLIIIVLGLFFFIIFLKKYLVFLKKYSKIFILIFGILIVAFLSYKTHDDFPYYHFPYTFYLTQENLIIGTGNLNHGFRTPSSLFYLNSLFYLPAIKFYSFHIGALIIFGVSNLILILKLKNDYDIKRYDFIFILTLLAFLFINIFFYRLSEHGTDRSAQILIFILFIEILSLIRSNIINNKFISKIFILLGIIISLKAFYILYLILLIPILYFIPKKNFLITIKMIFKNFYFYLFLFIGFSLISINIFNSGCILYPVSFTCFSSLDWSLYNEAEKMNNWYEQWSKAGATPNFRVADPENYIKGFNWVPNWIELYFFNKVSDFLAGMIFLMGVVFLTLFSRKKSDFKTHKNIYVIYFICLILFVEWFYNHPSLRYGGYSLIGLMMFIPFSIYLAKKITKKHLKNKIIFLITLSLVIFVGRNLNRIDNEINKYAYQPISYPFYEINETHFRIDSNIIELIQQFKNCENKNSEKCQNDKQIFIGKKNNYYYLKKNND